MGGWRNYHIWTQDLLRHVAGGGFNMDNAVNRTRVAKWRAEKFRSGYRELTVYVSPEVSNMINLLHRHFGTRRKTGELIEMAIKNLYEKNRRKLQ